MNDFIKIFLSMVALVCAFLFGRNYGEKTYRESEDFKGIASAKQELDYAKAELEDAKAKLQNIVDAAENKRTDELLGQILQVFLVDLGLRIQNKEMILKKASSTSAPMTAEQPKAQPPQQIIAEKETAEDRITQDGAKQMRQIKSYEWILGQASGRREALRNLDKLVIKNLNAYLSKASVEKELCEDFLGTYSGGVQDINNRKFGSMRFELKDNDGYHGKIAWYNDPNAPLTQQINNSCGRKVKGTQGRIFSMADDRYVQVYQLSISKEIAGNFYEVLPNGTTKRIGKFVLGRTDRF